MRASVNKVILVGNLGKYHTGMNAEVSREN